jgi:hypothetical protein
MEKSTANLRRRPRNAGAPDQAFIQRLEELSSQFRSRTAFATAAKIPPSNLQSYFEGAEPSRLTLVALAATANVSLEWLMLGRGYREPHPQVPDGYAAIPFFDIRKAGGYVYPLVAADVADFWYLRLDWFSYPGLQAGELSLLRGVDSLVPEIHQDDLVVSDGAWRTKVFAPNPVIEKGIYLVSQRAKLSIRRVLSVSNDVAELFPPRNTGSARVRIGDHGFAIHGRVIWYARALPPPSKTKT